MAEPRIYEGNGHHVTIADPENITHDECLALAQCGKCAWNLWRREFPSRGETPNYVNTAKFNNLDSNFRHFDFSGFDFSHGADFRNNNFGDAKFIEARFGNLARFESATFEAGHFERVRFGERANFSYTVFEYFASFEGGEFGDNAIFEAARVCGIGKFINTKFGSGARFSFAQFVHTVYFNSAIFNGSVRFTETIFGRTANFWGTQFSGAASFEPNERSSLSLPEDEQKKITKQWAHSHGLSSASFSDVRFPNAVFLSDVTFAGRQFEGATNFSAAQFHKAPRFHECKLHQDTSFDGAVFPRAAGDEATARAYRTLKLAFAQQQAIREEQRFFKLEMEEEAARETGWRRWLYRLYRELSDFGFSIGRPVILFFVATVLAAIIYGWQAGLVFDSASTHTAALVHFSLASAIPGLEKLADPAALRLFGEVSKGITNYSLPTVLTLLAHKAISLLALFLIGLALRNLFKMK